jgi:hypothetical protein
MTTANVEQSCDLKKEFFWTMFYRHGMNATLSKNFYFEGDMVAARKRAEQHSKVMGYKFIFIRPMVCNIESEEDYKQKGHVEGSE